MMKSGRYIGVMSGTSLDGVDVVLAAISDKFVAEQSSLSVAFPIELKKNFRYMPRANNNAIRGW